MAEAANFVVKASVNVKSLGDPKKLAVNLPADGDVALLGTIFGIAQGMNKRTSQDGMSSSYGLVGSFAAIPADPKRSEVHSNICYLPDQVQSQILASLRAAQETDPNAQVRFAMEASVCKGGQSGFTWEYRPLYDGQTGSVIDPLASMRAAIKGGQKSLPAPTAAEQAAVNAAMASAEANKFAGVVKPADVVPAKGHARK